MSSKSLELSHTHFRQMKKHLANIEKEWSNGALVAVKTELIQLDALSREIKAVIKNQLYHNLKDKAYDALPIKEQKDADT